MSLVKENK